MAKVRFFAQARDATGCRDAEVDGDTVGAVLTAAVERFGPDLARVIESSAIWLNGEETVSTEAIRSTDELAVLPPVSGG